MLTRRGSVAGFSLVELMVGLVAGLILLGSVLTLVAANMQNNSLVVRDMRVNQESRALASVMTRELRRNGYYGDSMRMIGAGFTDTDFPEVEALTSSCMMYGYDANSNGTLDAGERRLFSRGTVDGHGAVFRKLTTTAAGTFTSADCGTGTQVSSDDIDVKCLGFVEPDGSALTTDSGTACYDPASKPSPAVSISHPAGSIFLAMRVSMVDAPETSLRSETQISVRSPEFVASP
jgi:Tfp pilus assembly protein PilW